MQRSTTIPSAALPARRPARLSRVLTIGLALAAVLGVSGVLALMLGVTPIPPDEVLSILFSSSGERVPRLVIWTLRLPRFLLGALAGAALALVGALLQDALGNPRPSRGCSASRPGRRSPSRSCWCSICPCRSRRCPSCHWSAG